jgi:hypothetical protein
MREKRKSEIACRLPTKASCFTNTSPDYQRRWVRLFDGCLAAVQKKIMKKYFPSKFQFLSAAGGLLQDLNLYQP